MVAFPEQRLSAKFRLNWLLISFAQNFPIDTQTSKKILRGKIFSETDIFTDIKETWRGHRRTTEVRKNLSVDVNEVLDQILIYWIDYLLTSLHSFLMETDHDTNKNLGREIYICIKVLGQILRLNKLDQQDEMWHFYRQRYMAFHIGGTEERPRSRDVILPFPVTCTEHNVTAWGENIKGFYEHQWLAHSSHCSQWLDRTFSFTMWLPVPGSGTCRATWISNQQASCSTVAFKDWKQLYAPV